MQGHFTDYLNPGKILLVGHEDFPHYDVAEGYSHLQYAAASYTVRSKSFRTVFLQIEDILGGHITILIQNKIHWHIYRLLRDCTVSEKLPKISLFVPSLIHHLRLLGSQQHPQSGEILTLFSTWGNRK
jgi:hypothetical protein